MAVMAGKARTLTAQQQLGGAIGGGYTAIFRHNQQRGADRIEQGLEMIVGLDRALSAPPAAG